LKLFAEHRAASDKDDFATLEKLTVPDPILTLGNPPRLLTREMAMNRRKLARERGIIMGPVVLRQRTGADCPVVVKKWGNAHGAKGATQAGRS
jgi:hypothetical protein